MELKKSAIFGFSKLEKKNFSSEYVPSLYAGNASILLWVKLIK